MRKLLLLCAVSLLLVFPVVANAVPIPPISAELTGTRSTAADVGGITATDGWNNTGDFNGFEISWDITPTTVGTTTTYSYQYTISGEGDDLSKGLSHWILEVTAGSEESDFWNVNPGFSSDSPKLWNHTQASNPYMLSDIYGIKWDADDSSSSDVLTYTVSFDTEKDPVWGDFYAKDGTQGGQDAESEIYATAYNVGFGTDPDADTTDFTNWIATPDGANGGGPGGDPIPEPATMLLLGSGLIGIAVSGKKKLKKRNG